MLRFIRKAPPGSAYVYYGRSYTAPAVAVLITAVAMIMAALIWVIRSVV